MNNPATPATPANAAYPPTQLPIPLFRVLAEERRALGFAAPESFSWRFEADQLLGPLEAIRDAIVLLNKEAVLPANAEKAAYVQALNALITQPEALCSNRRFPKERLRDEARLLLGLPVKDLSPDDRQRLNRLLLEEAFPGLFRRIDKVHLEKVWSQIHADPRPQSALCLSGGGIRSATFALGVMQGLSAHKVMPEFDYLSTVSGGGYIGSWLSAWLHHAKAKRGKAEEQVFKELAFGIPAGNGSHEPEPLQHLRAFSNYLTPKLGLFSADAWTLLGTYLRNICLNWAVFIPILLAIFAVPRLTVSLLAIDPREWLTTLTLGIGIIAAVVAVFYAAVCAPADTPRLIKRRSRWLARRGQESFLCWFLAPMTLAAVCFTTAWGWTTNARYVQGELGPWLADVVFGIGEDGGPHWLNLVVFGAAIHAVGWLSGEWVTGRLREPGAEWGKLSAEFLVGVLFSGVIGGLLLFCMATWSHRELVHFPGLEIYASFAAPGFLLVLLIAATAFAGFSSNYTSDSDREWWARMGAWVLIVAAAWSLFACLTLFAPLALLNTPKAISSLGGISGLVAVLLGHSGTTAASQDTSGGWRARLPELALKLATPLFLAVFIAGLSLVTGWLLIEAAAAVGLGAFFGELSNPFTSEAAKVVIHNAPAPLVAGFILACAVAGFFLSWFINVNKFSIHAVYRNRLVRAYLGASHSDRQPNPLTGFDPRDNLRLGVLREPPQRPLHIINMALNLVGGKNLAWQQRKAETFTASALHSGNGHLGYRPTPLYAQNQDGRGLSLGTAVAISGAAASPNQGYHSSPMVALVMTLFNVRLGFWLGNPGLAGQTTYTLSAPRSGVWQMTKEGLSLTDESSPYVYLSDGGHFENLGLYEMVQRRCRLVVVSDSGCDPDCGLEDLGNAIRKIRVDQGVEIRFQLFRIFSRHDSSAPKLGKYLALGEIDYSAVDGSNARPGLLIYFKPTLLGTESKDVFNYAATSRDFPHESTADQWFSESQFESYRCLGRHMLEQLYSPARNWCRQPEWSGELEELVGRALAYLQDAPASDPGPVLTAVGS